MNVLKDQAAVMKKKPTKTPAKSTSVEVDERKLIGAIYSHYGTPENVVSEKLSIYREYRTPAGYSQPDWCEDGWQRGRLSVYTKQKLLDKDGSDTGMMRTLIAREGEGSWFFHTNGTHIKIFMGEKIDTIIEM